MEAMKTSTEEQRCSRKSSKIRVRIQALIEVTLLGAPLSYVDASASAQIFVDELKWRMKSFKRSTKEQGCKQNSSKIRVKIQAMKVLKRSTMVQSYKQYIIKA